MFIKLLLITVGLLAVSALFFGIRILFKSNGKFPETHISRNKEMQKLGIKCAQDTNIGCSVTDGTDECSTCGRRVF